jgi:hypothetical protein
MVARAAMPSAPALDPGKPDVAASATEDQLEWRSAVDRTEGSQGFVAIFLSLIAAVGSGAGVLMGLILDGVVQNRRLLAILAGFFSVGVATAVRVIFARRAPSLFLAKRGTGLPRAIVISACVTSLAGGLAAHDLSRFAEITSGWMIGFLSGSLSALMMALLMMIHFYRHPEEGLEV